MRFRISSMLGGSSSNEIQVSRTIGEYIASSSFASSAVAMRISCGIARHCPSSATLTQGDALFDQQLRQYFDRRWRVHLFSPGDEAAHICNCKADSVEVPLARHSGDLSRICRSDKRCIPVD